ncbi:MAG: PPOX class F420-dependent oxidoreductase [Thermomicrobiales bacterium]
MTTLPDSVTDLLKPPALAYVATIGPTGAPHVSPVIFSWDGEYIRFSMNAIRQKRKNLERDPRIALSITDPENPFRTVEIRGRVVRIDPDDDYAYNRFISNLYFHQDGSDKLLPGEQRVVVVVEPQRFFPFLGTPSEGSSDSA